MGGRHTCVEEESKVVEDGGGVGLMEGEGKVEVRLDRGRVSCCK